MNPSTKKARLLLPDKTNKFMSHIGKTDFRVYYVFREELSLGIAPYLDIFIRSSTDPLLSLQYHRQFTHSIIFIPFGGLICALFLFIVFKKISPFNFKMTWLYCTLGYGTHGLIDACTSYGTLLFWPFSDMRIAWNNISIIDPLFTLPLILLIVIATIKKKNIYSKNKNYLINLNILNFVINPSLKLKDFSETIDKILKSKIHKLNIDVKYLIENDIQKGTL